MKLSKFTVFLILFLFIITPLFAYIDPGSGSLLVSSFIGISITLVYVLRGLFYKLINRLSGGRVKDSLDFTGRLVFFNEGKNYWAVFKPVLDEMIADNNDFVYLSADKDDPGLGEMELMGIESHYIGHMSRAIIHLNRIKAKVLVLTTPQLGVIQLKRSPFVSHYSHLLHAPIDIHTYKKFAFDYYDSVLCSSSSQMVNLRQLEKDRKRMPKQLFETGCTYYDLAPKPKDIPRDSLLLAPTWGEKSFLSEDGIGLIETLLEMDMPLIFRPHPQSWISDKELLDRIETQFSSRPGFSIDKSPDNFPSLNRAKIMICDFSGVVFDFLLIHKQPVIAIDKVWKDGGYESSDLEQRQSTYDLLERAGRIINREQLDELPSLIDALVKDKVELESVEDFIFNFRCAGKVAAKQIGELC